MVILLPCHWQKSKNKIKIPNQASVNKITSGTELEENGSICDRTIKGSGRELSRVPELYRWDIQADGLELIRTGEGLTMQ